VRSSKCGQIERSFRFNSDSVAMSQQCNTLIHKDETFIYLHRLSPCEIREPVFSRSTARVPENAVSGGAEGQERVRAARAGIVVRPGVGTP
jgi:hypothetical protein